MTRQFPGGFGSIISDPNSIDNTDTVLVAVDGIVQEATIPAMSQVLGRYSGVIDVADFSSLTAQLLVDCETTAGWTATLTPTVARVTSSHSQGAACISWGANFTNGTANGKCYFTFATPQPVGTHSMLGIDVSFDTTGGIGNRPDFFVMKVADGPALTGNVITAAIPTAAATFGGWRTVIIPLEGLTSIKSVGMERLDVVGYSTNPTATAGNRMDNIRFLDESPLDQALASGLSAGVIVGTTYTDSPTQQIPQFEDDKHVLDFRRGSYSGFNRTIWLDSYYIDPTGATDVTDRFMAVCNSAPRGAVVKAPANALYRFDGKVTFSYLNEVTIDLGEATCFITWELLNGIDSDFIEINNCSYVKLIVGEMYGYHDQTQPANSLSVLSGTPVLTAGNVSYDLSTQNDAVKTSSDSVRAWPMARTLNQQVGLPGNDGPRWNYKFNIADTTHVAGDVMIYVYDSITLAVLASKTITATSTPTDYWLSFDPLDTRVLPLAAVQKVTATANTISIYSNSRYGRVNYDATYDSASGISPTFSEHITICGPEGGMGIIEGFGADAIQFSEPNVHFVEIRNIVSRGNRRQGMSVNAGSDVVIEHCVIEGSGRSAFDFEPYTNTALVTNLYVNDVELWTPRNYCIAFTNWQSILNLTLNNLRMYNPGIGYCVGGSRGGKYTNWKCFRKDGKVAIDSEINFSGIDLDVSDIQTDGRVWLVTETKNNSGVDYTCINNKASNLKFFGGTELTGTWRVYARGGGWNVDGVAYSTTQEANLTVGNAINYKSIGMNFDDLTKWNDVDLGELIRQFPNTYKGPAYKSVWIPGGFNMLDEAVYQVHSISGTTTRSNNLRGIGVPVTTGNNSVTVVFPSQMPGVFTTTPQAVSWTGTGTLVPLTTYYYRMSPRTRWIGPRTWASQNVLAMPAGKTQALLKFVSAVDHTNHRVHEGWSILRGTVNGGPYTQRVDIVPIEQIFSHVGKNIELFDNGGTLDFNNSASSAFQGFAVSRPWVDGTYTAIDESGYEADTLYSIQVTPSWPTTVGVGPKTVAGFTVTFGTPAPAGATIDWVLVR